MLTRPLPLTLLPLLLAACSGSEPPKPAPTPAPTVVVDPTSAPQESTTLFGLETREHQLFLLSTPEGERYTVKSKDGHVLADQIDEVELGRDYPALFALLHGGVDGMATGPDSAALDY